MATEIISSPAEGSVVLSSAIGTIKASTDNRFVSVRVVRDFDNGEQEELFTTSLFATNRLVELYDLQNIVEENFRKRGLSYDDITVYFDDANVTFIVVYCEYALHDFTPESCFWTSSRISVVHANSAVSLYHWPRVDLNYVIKVVGVDINGRMVSLSWTYQYYDQGGPTGAGYTVFAFRVNDIIDRALNRTEYETGIDMVEVGYFAVSFGNIQNIFFLAKDPFYLTFNFRNMFNVPEYVDLVCKVKRKTTVDRKVAVCGGIAHPYDRTIERVYEVETAPLTEAQAMTIEQLVCSHDVLLCAAENDYKIIITDNTCEVDNDDENLTTMKFTFRFANNCPTLFGDELQSLVPSPSHIFSNQFTAEFS